MFDYFDSDVEGTVPKVPPMLCPECGHRVLTYCVVCKFPLEKVPSHKDPYCPVCDINLLVIEFRDRRRLGPKSGTAVRTPKVVSNRMRRRLPSISKHTNL